MDSSRRLPRIDCGVYSGRQYSSRLSQRAVPSESSFTAHVRINTHHLGHLVFTTLSFPPVPRPQQVQAELCILLRILPHIRNPRSHMELLFGMLLYLLSYALYKLSVSMIARPYYLC